MTVNDIVKFVIVDCIFILFDFIVVWIVNKDTRFSKIKVCERLLMKYCLFERGEELSARCKICQDFANRYLFLNFYTRTIHWN